MYLYLHFTDICKINKSFPELTSALDGIILSRYTVSEAKTAGKSNSLTEHQHLICLANNI